MERQINLHDRTGYFVEVFETAKSKPFEYFFTQKWQVDELLKDCIGKSDNFCVDVTYLVHGEEPSFCTRHNANGCYNLLLLTS